MANRTVVYQSDAFHRFFLMLEALIELASLEGDAGRGARAYRSQTDYRHQLYSPPRQPTGKTETSRACSCNAPSNERAEYLY